MDVENSTVSSRPHSLPLSPPSCSAAALRTCRVTRSRSRVRPRSRTKASPTRTSERRAHFSVLRHCIREGAGWGWTAVSYRSSQDRGEWEWTRAVPQCGGVQSMPCTSRKEPAVNDARAKYLQMAERPVSRRISGFVEQSVTEPDRRFFSRNGFTPWGRARRAREQVT